MKNRNKNLNWDLIISSKKGWLDLNLKEVFQYIDLIFLFVKRDFVTFYKQTILGPLWYIIQPLANTLVFTIIFGKVAKISTDGISPFLFYLSGTVVWSYFASCVTLTADTFTKNSDIFGKVYFPRIIVPISNVIVSLLQFAIQFSIFLSFLIYYNFQGEILNFNFMNILFLPLVLLQLIILSLGVGILLSALTAKYRDLTFALSFGLQLWMFATPIVYPLSIVPEKYKIISALNPATSIVELFRGAFLGVSSIEFSHILISLAVTIFIFICGLLLFTKIEQNFMDTV